MHEITLPFLISIMFYCFFWNRNFSVIFPIIHYSFKLYITLRGNNPEPGHYKYPIFQRKKFLLFIFAADTQSINYYNSSQDILLKIFVTKLIHTDHKLLPKTQKIMYNTRFKELTVVVLLLLLLHILVFSFLLER